MVVYLKTSLIINWESCLYCKLSNTYQRVVPSFVKANPKQSPPTPHHHGLPIGEEVGIFHLLVFDHLYQLNVVFFTSLFYHNIFHHMLQYYFEIIFAIYSFVMWFPQVCFILTCYNSINLVNFIKLFSS